MRGLFEKESTTGQFISGISPEANRRRKGSLDEVEGQATGRSEVPKATAYGFVYC